MKIRLFTLAIAILGFTSVSLAQSETAAGTIRLLTPISITKDLDLRFGSVLTNNAAGTVIIGHTGAAVRTLGAGFSDISTGDTYGAAKFIVAGTIDQAFKITLPATASLAGPTGSTPLVVSAFTSDHATGSTLGTSGSKIVLVGAKITIPASQPGGLYSGTFNVTVAYQ